MTAIVVRVEPGAFDVAAEIARLKQLDQASPGPRSGVGALVTFTGVCRDEGGRLTALELEHFPGMAEAEILRIAREAAARWPLAGITVVHRHGRIAVGDDIVLVATASSHREAAFAAANFLMDYLKTSAPFWKKEHTTAGDAGGWVAASDDDDEAAERWR